MYNIIMKTIISSTEVHKNISDMIDAVRETGRVFLIGRRGEAEGREVNLMARGEFGDAMRARTSFAAVL